MPFASVDSSNQTLSVHAPALHALAALPAPICVLSVAGPAHEGKSSWLNMFSHSLSERWTTVGGAGKDFKVGSSIFDAGTEGAWMRLFTGKGGEPLAGTKCTSVALIDIPGPPRGLSLDPSAGTAAHRLFALSAVASSTVTLNVMSPVLNQLAQ